jgi:hypothetical protein
MVNRSEHLLKSRLKIEKALTIEIIREKQDHLILLSSKIECFNKIEIQTIDLSARSLDLNLIENLWGVLNPQPILINLNILQTNNCCRFCSVEIIKQ